MPKKTAKKVTKKAATRAIKKAAKKAGRPKGSGKYGCETKAVRIPVHLEKEIQSFILRRIKAGK